MLVDFWADWCQPCKMLEPELEAVEEELGDEITVAKVNVDEHQGLAQSYDVSAIPLVLLFHDGTIQERFDGVKQSDELIESVNRCRNGSN